MPKFTEPPAYPDLRYKGSPGGPEHEPLAEHASVDGIASYETLFSFLGPEGQQLAAAYPGSYGPYLMQAGRHR